MSGKKIQLTLVYRGINKGEKSGESYAKFVSPSKEVIFELSRKEIMLSSLEEINREFSQTGEDSSFEYVISKEGLRCARKDFDVS